MILSALEERAPGAWKKVTSRVVLNAPSSWDVVSRQCVARKRKLNQQGWAQGPYVLIEQVSEIKDYSLLFPPQRQKRRDVFDRRVCHAVSTRLRSRPTKKLGVPEKALYLSGAMWDGD